MNKVFENIEKSLAAGLILDGALENALTSAINSADPVGGWSVEIDREAGEIWCFQHPGAGGSEKTFKFGDRDGDTVPDDPDFDFNEDFRRPFRSWVEKSLASST